MVLLRDLVDVFSRQEESAYRRSYGLQSLEVVEFNPERTLHALANVATSLEPRWANDSGANPNA